MVTISDVAKLAGVSIGTVSNMINNTGKVKKSTAEAIQKAIDELGYIPNSAARNLKSGMPRNIGIICEDVSAFSSGGIIDGICEYCEDRDFSVTLQNLRMNRRMEGLFPDYASLDNSPAFRQIIARSVDNLLADRVSGIIYIGIYPRNVSEMLPAIGMPLVYTYCYTSKKDYCVNYDDFQGGLLAVENLIAHGHRKIGVICGTFDTIPSHKRLLGYQTALMEHGIPYVPEYVRAGNWRYLDGYEQCCALLDLPKPPTAIFGMSDVMANGAMNAAQDRGLNIPRQLSVQGFDNLELSDCMRPALTTVSLPLHEMGLTCAKTIISCLDGQPPEEHSILIPCTSVPRKSVGEPALTPPPR